MDLSRSSDPELIERCRADQRAAHASFRALYERHAPAVLRFLRGLLEEELARDALQETFLRVYRQLERFDPGRPFGPWVLGIARHVAQDVQRRRARRPAGPLEGEVQDPRASSPERELERAEERGLLRGCVAALPSTEREVFLLKQVEGLTYEQVAAAVGCSVRTAKYRMKAALERLERELRQRGLEESS
ncbi:MAG: RNA polymerase sigma factor [Planctomycetota bacterium]